MNGIPKIMARNFVIIAISLMLIAAVLIIPNYFGIQDLESEAAELRTRLDEQQMLLPVFADLIKRSKAGGGMGLPLPKRQALSNDEIKSVLSSLKDEAGDMDLRVKELVPCVRGFLESSKRVEVSAVLMGSTDGFRRYILYLSQQPYVDIIQSVRFRIRPEGTECRIRFWIARQV